MQSSHLGTATPTGPYRFLPRHDAAAEDLVFSSTADSRHCHVFAFGTVEITFNCRREGNVVHAAIGCGIDKTDLLLLDLEQCPFRVAAIEDQMVVAVAFKIGREVVTSVAVEDRATLW